MNSEVKKYSRWKKEEIDFLKQNYKYITAKKIANKLNRTHGSVTKKKYELKLTKQMSWNREKTIKELKRLNKKLNYSPAVREIPVNLYYACCRYFNSFNKAKQDAGLSITKYENKVTNKKLTKELAYILGVISGDGYINLRKDRNRTSSLIGLKVKDKDFSLEFKRMLEKWSGCEVKFSEILNGFYHTRLHSITGTKIIKTFDLKSLFLAPLEIQCQFIKGMFDSEGGVICHNLNNRRNAKRWIHFSNSDKKLINMVTSILNNLNIKYSVKSRIHSGFGSKKLQYELMIYGLENFIKYQKYIGFSIKRKEDKLLEMINSYENGGKICM